MECNSVNQTVSSTKTSKYENSLLSFNSNCCYGLDNNSQCIKDINSCLSTFVNKGWSICCTAGNFYSPANQNCVEDCEGGTVLFDSVCMSTSKALDLRGSSLL